MFPGVPSHQRHCLLRQPTGKQGFPNAAQSERRSCSKQRCGCAKQGAHQALACSRYRTACPWSAALPCASMRAASRAASMLPKSANHW